MLQLELDAGVQLNLNLNGVWSRKQARDWTECDAPKPYRPGGSSSSSDEVVEDDGEEAECVLLGGERAGEVDTREPEMTTNGTQSGGGADAQVEGEDEVIGRCDYGFENDVEWDGTAWVESSTLGDDIEACDSLNPAYCWKCSAWTNWFAGIDDDPTQTGCNKLVPHRVGGIYTGAISATCSLTFGC